MRSGVETWKPTSDYQVVANDKEQVKPFVRIALNVQCDPTVIRGELEDGTWRCTRLPRDLVLNLRSVLGEAHPELTPDEAWLRTARAFLMD